jgi:hypothetical protein
MTYAQALKDTGINLEKSDQYETYEFWGTTPSGKKFHMYKAAGAYGNKFTLYIGGERKATACLYRTAVKLIKTN